MAIYTEDNNQHSDGRNSIASFYPKKKKAITRQLFCSIYSEMAKMRRKDPIQFEVSFNDWKRLRKVL